MKNKSKINNAWVDSYSVSHSKAMICGNMICDACKKKITGNYLIHDRTNYLLRGNESDERYLYHRSCSQDNVKWEEFDKDKVAEKKAIKLMKNRVKEVDSIIRKYNLEEVYGLDT